MPEYVFHCPTCGDFDKFLPMSTPTSRLRRAVCACGKSCRRNYRAEQVHVRPDLEDYFSQARGVIHPEERIPGEIYNNQGDMLIRGRKHHEATMKKTGLRPLR